MDINLLKNGGKILIAGGWNTAWASFRNHPQLVFWTGSPAEIARNVKGANGNVLPSNTHGIILSKFISHSSSQPIREDARRKRVPVIGPLTDGAITELLDDLVRTAKEAEVKPVSTPPPALKPSSPAVKPTGRGDVKAFVEQYHKPGGSIKEESERLMKLAQEAGLKTTHNSLAWRVGKIREDLGIQTRKKPRKLKPVPPPPEVVVEMKRIGAPVITRVQAETVAQTLLDEVAAPPAVKLTQATKFDTLLSMIRDSIASLHLLEEEVEKLKARDSKLDQLRAALKDLE